MKTAFYVLLGIVANAILGIIVLDEIDDEDRTLFNWYSACPDPTGLLQFLVLALWPVTAYFWLRGKGRQ